MATQSRPFVNKGVALASAAAIAAATPAIMPTLDVPTHALATAEVQLANFADVMSVPAETWTDILFGNTNYGGFLSATNYGPEWAAPQTVALQQGYVNPWVPFCTDSNGNGSCFTSGIAGVQYLFFDALINGDGSGFENSANWKIGIVNYLFEPNFVYVLGGGSSPTLQFDQAGLSAAAWYALQGTLGQLVPDLTIPIAAAFQGSYNLSVAYNLALSVVALALRQVPLIGPFAGNSILAYLGDLVIPGTEPPPAGTNPDGPLYYQYGLSGTLNYWVDILTGSVPFPTTAVPPGSASLAAAAAPVEAATALVSATASATSTALKGDVAEATAAAAPEATPAAEAVDATPAATPAVQVADATPAVETPAVEGAESSPVAEAPESVATPAADLPAAEVADSAPVKAPKRPVRSAVERVAKSVQSALGVTKADTAGRDAVSPGSAAGSAGSVGSVATAAESSSSDAGSADSDASSASSDAGSADSAG
jgi:hypothetical protein